MRSVLYSVDFELTVSVGVRACRPRPTRFRLSDLRLEPGYGGRGDFRYDCQADAVFMTLKIAFVVQLVKGIPKFI